MVGTAYSINQQRNSIQTNSYLYPKMQFIINVFKNMVKHLQFLINY
jgi:hypothetical protein